MGVDLNADSIAHAVLSHELVLLSYGKKFFPQGGPKGARATALFRQVNALVAEAKARQLGISLEFLEFEGSKRWLKNKLGQILRMFPYRKIRAMFESRCRAAGVPLRFVPPGYSSVLGALFAQRWPELGRDQAACVVLAARAFEAGNRWLEAQCRAAVQAERITLRFNAKGLFGHNTTVIRPAQHRAEDGHQREHPRQPRTLSPLRWQTCCGKSISDVLATLRSDFRAKVLAARRAAVAQGRSKSVPRPMVPALFKLEHREGFPRNAQLCSGSN
jgi:IS605 OrfB family transposase